MELTGEVTAAGSDMHDMLESKQCFILVAVYLYKLQLSYHFGFINLAKATLQEMKHLRISFNYVPAQFFVALTCCELYRKQGKHTLDRLESLGSASFRY
jgi:hypothetical protein